MYVLVLTGGTGSGKSTAAAWLAERGSMRVDTDEVARHVRESDEVKAQLAERFGSRVIGPAGEVDSAALAEEAFATPEATADLNAIMHPAILARVADALSPSCFSGADPAPLAVVEVPLLAPGSPYLGLADEVMAITAPVELRVARAVMRGMDEGDARRRIARQATDEERARVADTVIANDGTVQELRDKVDAWYDALAARGFSSKREG